MSDDYTRHLGSSEITLKESSTKPDPNYTITFHGKDGKQVGKLDCNGDNATFEGDMGESADAFFQYLMNMWPHYIEERIKEDSKPLPSYASITEFSGPGKAVVKGNIIYGMEVGDRLYAQPSVKVPKHQLHLELKTHNITVVKCMNLQSVKNSNVCEPARLAEQAWRELDILLKSPKEKDATHN